jgi:tetratricopeptide (TPR) repeat protein
MSTNFRIFGVLLLSIGLATTFTPESIAAGRGGGRGGGGGGGPHISSGGGSGVHIGGGSGTGTGIGSGSGAAINRSGGAHNLTPQGSHITPGQLPKNLNLGKNLPDTIGKGNWDHGNWNRGNWDQGHWNHGDWNHHPNWNNYNHWWHDHGNNWIGWWGIGIGWPGVGIGWWPGYYGSYYYPGAYSGDVYVDYNTYYNDTEPVPYTAAYAPADSADAPDTTDASQASSGGGDLLDFYPQALSAFQQGDFRNATRLATHASIDDPKNPEVHLLMMMGLFAIGEYRGAAMEGHAVVALSKQLPDWNKIYSLYGKLEPYTEHLRALEKFVRDKPKAPEGRFLLGIQYLMANHKDAAKNELLQAVKLMPKDKQAVQLLKLSGGTVPADIATQQAPPPPPDPNEGTGKDKK